MNRLIKILTAILLILAALLLIVTLSIDGIIKTEIEEQGAEMLRTGVHIDDVDISIFSGKGSINGFVIDNPDGFSDEPALRFEQANIEVMLSSLLSDEIIVKSLIIKNPVVFFEQTGTQINLQTLNDHLGSASTGDSEKLLIIDYLLIEKGTLKVSSTIDREREAEVTMESFELNGIGREGNKNVKESLKQILEPLMEQAIEEAAKKGLFEQLENRLQDFIEN